MNIISDIAYQNKDIVSKAFADNFPSESLEVYGIHLPKIKNILPTDLPAVEANELRIDRIFQLEDDSFAIIDYESVYKSVNKLKYLGYIIRILRKYAGNVAKIHLHMIVLYTADVERSQTKETLDVGAVCLTIEQAFLSEINSEEVRNRLTSKIKNHELLTNKELMEFVILPLTYKGDTAKNECIKHQFESARHIQDENVQTMLLAGILVFADKVINEEMAIQMKGWMMMTKVERLYELEKIEACKKVADEAEKKVAIAEKKVALAEKKTAITNASRMLIVGKLTLEEVALCSGLSLNEVKALSKEKALA